MTCDEFSERVSDYIEGELGASDRADMDHHADDCPSCARLVKDMLALTDRMARLPRCRPSAGFDFAVRGRILMEVAREGKWQRRLQGLLRPAVPRIVLAGAAAVVLAVGLTAALNQNPARQAPEAGRETYPAEINHRGALKWISQEESYTLSGRLYRPLTDSLNRMHKSAVRTGDTPEVRRVPVRF